MQICLQNKIPPTDTQLNMSNITEITTDETRVVFQNGRERHSHNHYDIVWERTLS